MVVTATGGERLGLWISALNTILNLMEKRSESLRDLSILIYYIGNITGWVYNR